MTKNNKNKNNIEKNNGMIKTMGLVFGVLLLIIGLFFASEMTGDRSKDKAYNSNSNTNSDSSENHDGHDHSTEEGEEANPLMGDDKWSEEEQTEVSKISFSEFKSELKKDKLTVVMLSTDTCYWCVNQKPVLEHFVYLNSKVNVKILDVAQLASSDMEYLSELDSQLASFGTPTFIAIKSGKVTSVQTGAKDLSSLEAMFKTMGAI